MHKIKSFEQRISECMIKLNSLIKKFDKILEQSAKTNEKYLAALRQFDKEIIEKQDLPIKNLD
ncbi:unnamed protein product [marine sediment metagenome]|uniref:Uncharacterized protein n=2 Tax=marine sediment metagenome TaxID=412755 RepID=X1PF13_9ZZZZ